MSVILVSDCSNYWERKQAVDMWKADPNLKVILGVRDSAQVWYKSAKSTILTETGKPEIDAIFDRF